MGNNRSIIKEMREESLKKKYISMQGDERRKKGKESKKRRNRKHKKLHERRGMSDMKIAFLNIQGGRGHRKWKELVEDSNMQDINVIGVTESFKR